MKKVFISILMFFWGFHFFLPWLYYKIFGYVNIYSDIRYPYIINKAFLLNSISIFGAIFFILFLPDRKKLIIGRFKHTTKLFFLSILYILIFYIFSGGYLGIRSGELSGSYLAYIKLFLNVFVILFMALYFQKSKVYFTILIVIYVILQTMLGSRSAIISIIMIFILGSMFKNFNQYKKIILKYIIILGIISPLLFFYATFSRGSKLDKQQLKRMIIGRVSLIELAMLPIYFKDMKKENELRLFYKKYHLIHQGKLIFNSFFPGNLFIHDVDPNQYYRSIFLGLSEKRAREYYTSINMTLPTYFYMYSNFYVACFLFIIFIWLYYIIWILVGEKNIYIFIMLLLNLYSLLYFFDFVMYFRELFSSLLTIIMVVLFDKTYDILNKKKFYNLSENMIK